MITYIKEVDSHQLGPIYYKQNPSTSKHVDRTFLNINHTKSPGMKTNKSLL